MPYKDRARHTEMNRQSMRRRRVFAAALAAGHPKALEAERLQQIAKDPMREANALYDALAALPRGERLARKAEYEAVRARCAAVDRDAARAEAARLRQVVIAEAEIFS